MIWHLMMGHELIEAEWHIFVGKLTIIGSDNGLSPGRHQAIIWTSAGTLLIGSLGTNFSEISIRIQTVSFKKIYLKMSPAKWHAFSLGLSVLKGVPELYPQLFLITEIRSGTIYQRNLHFYGLVQERRNSIALAMELHLSCTNSSKFYLACQTGVARHWCFKNGLLHYSCFGR